MTRLGKRDVLDPRDLTKEDDMSMTSHLQELRRKHAMLSDRVEQAQRNPGSDAAVIMDLKKQKLRLKDEINRLTEH